MRRTLEDQAGEGDALLLATVAAIQQRAALVISDLAACEAAKYFLSCLM